MIIPIMIMISFLIYKFADNINPPKFVFVNFYLMKNIFLVKCINKNR